MSHTATPLLRSRNVNAFSTNNQSKKTSKARSYRSSLPLHRQIDKTSRKWWTNKALIIFLLCIACVTAHRHIRSGATEHGGPVALPKSSTFSVTVSRGLDEVTETGKRIYDVIIVGAGPAGLSAALFAARANLNVLVTGSPATGLLSETMHLDNFPGFFNPEDEENSKSGPSWLNATHQQAISFGAQFAPPGILVNQISAVPVKNSKNDVFALTTSAANSSLEHELYGWSVVLATGATPRHLELAHEELLWGQYLHSCAICDGHLYADKTVLVVGGGDAAVDAAILLARHAKHVYMVHRRMGFLAKNLGALDVVRSTANIQLMQPYVVEEWILDGPSSRLTGARIRNQEDQSEMTLKIDGSFCMIGATPNSQWLTNLVDLDDEGLIQVPSSSSATQTSTRGIFAAGEVTDNRYKQAITASASGAQAAIDVERWLRTTLGVMRRQNNRVKATPKVPERKPVEVKEKIIERVLEDDCDLTTEACIRQVVNKHPVVVFSKSWCPYCRKALEALNAAGVQNPYVIDLSKKSNTRDIQATLHSMTQRRTVPNVFVDGRSIGGGDETAALQSQGKLVPLLQAAGAIPSTEGGESCDLSQRSCIDDIIRKYPVIMFSLSWCPECKRSLELLTSIGPKEPHIVDLDDYKPISTIIRGHMSDISGRRSVPNLFIGGEHFGGLIQTRKMHEQGKLVTKLKEVGWPVNPAR